MGRRSVIHQVAQLEKMSITELRQKMEELTGKPCSQTHRRYLIKRLAFLVQERHYGGISEEAKAQIAELRQEFEGTDPASWFNPPSRRAQDRPRRVRPGGRDPRLPNPGTVLVRHFRGQDFKVEVQEKGFVLNGQPFKSLSGVAQAICGSHVSGFRFFGLTDGGAA